MVSVLRRLKPGIVVLQLEHNTQNQRHQLHALHLRKMGRVQVSQAHEHKHQQPLIFRPESLVGVRVISERERMAAQVFQPGQSYIVDNEHRGGWVNRDEYDE